MTYTYRPDPATQQQLRESQATLDRIDVLLGRAPGATRRAAPPKPVGPSLEEAQRQLEDAFRGLAESLHLEGGEAEHFVRGRGEHGEPTSTPPPMIGLDERGRTAPRRTPPPASPRPVELREPISESDAQAALESGFVSLLGERRGKIAAGGH